MNPSTDRIVSEILLKAPQARVWRALTNVDEFGRWFGVDLTGQTFAAGGSVKGRILHPAYAHVIFDIDIERMEPPRYLSWRWHPAAIERGVDYSKEPRTLVEFELKEVAGGTQLRVVESGFDQVPLARRAEAFRMNSGGWAAQVKNIEKHVATP